MELIAVPVRASYLAHGLGPGGEFVLSHRAVGLSRGLDVDEEVIVVDPEGEFHAAYVVDLEIDVDDTRYVLELGARLPPEQVRERLGGTRPAFEEEESTHSVVDLLGWLRDHGTEPQP